MQHHTFAFVVFLLVFIVVFVSVHVYIYHRTCTALEPGKVASLIIGIFFITMIFSPLIIRFAQKHELQIISTFFAYTGYTWMGIVSTLFLTLLFFDILTLLLNFIFKYVNIGRNLLIHSDRYSFLLSLILSLLFTTVGIFEARDVRVNQILIESNHLKKELSPLRIIQISDLHISQTLGYRFLSDIMGKIQKLNFDIFVITGDLMDVDIRKNQKIIDAFRNITARYGKYAVAGNHEFYTGIDIASQVYEKAGIRFLRGEYVSPVQGLIIIGVDDDDGRRFDNYIPVSESDILQDIKDEAYVVLLKHKPYVDNRVYEHIDLQLSGHTHGGQIFPFSLIVKSIYRYFGGLYQVSNRMYLYVNRGAGYWGPPVRFLSPPEVTLITIQHKD